MSTTVARVAKRQRPWLVLLVIWMVFVVHGIDRSIMSVLLEPIRRAFGLSDAAVGLLVGLGFALPFALAGIPWGVLADRVKRTWMLASLLAGWSVLTALAGFTPTYPLLVLVRAAIGAVEAGAPPAMLSLLGDTFNARSRPAALSVYYTAPFVGLIAGSIIAGHLSQAYGWRAALLVVGLPGVLLAVVVALVLREPTRGQQEADPESGMKSGIGAGVERVASASIGATLRFVAGEPELRRLITALVLGGFVTLAIASWTPAFLQRVHGMSQGRSGAMTALAIGVTGGIGSLAGGWLGARFGRGDPARLKRLSGFAILLATPLACLAPFLHSVPATLVLLGLWSVTGSAYLGPGWGLAIAATPAHMRGTVMAIAVVLTNLIGAGMGPQSVGLISDLLARYGDPDHLRHALSAVSLVGFVTAGLFLRGTAATRNGRLPAVVERTS